MESEPKKITQVDILGVTFYALTWEESLLIFEALLVAGNQYQIAKANPEFVMTAQDDLEDMEILSKTAFNVADGTGILWAATFLSLPPRGYIGSLLQLVISGASIVFNPKSMRRVLPARVGGVEHVVDECRIAAKHGVGVFLLGGSDEARNGAKAYLMRAIPELSITGDAGSFTPFEEEQKLVDAVNLSGAGFLIVCFGHPLQEKWIYKNLKRMPSVRVADGEGGTFDYMAGIQKRAPKILQKIGLEWFFRMLTQRGRGAKMKNSLPKFIMAVFNAKLLHSKLKKRSDNAKR